MPLVVEEVDPDFPEEAAKARASNTGLLITAADSKDLNVVRQIVEQGVDVNGKTEDDN